VTSSKPSASKIGVTSLIVISLLQFGQMSTVGTTEHASLVLMTFPFARQNVGAAKRLTLEWVPANLKSKSWKLAGLFCDSDSIAKIVRLLSARVEENECCRSLRSYPLQMLAFRSRQPRPGRLPRCLKGVRPRSPPSAHEHRRFTQKGVVVDLLDEEIRYIGARDESACPLT
jgi:hypothetical protein